MTTHPVAAPTAPLDVNGDNFVKPAISVALLLLISGLISQEIGTPVPLFLLLWLPLLIKFVILAPPHQGIRYLFAVGLMLEGPSERAGNEYWDPPFQHPSLTFYGGLNSWTVIPGLSLPLIFFLCIGLWLRARKQGPRLGYQAPPPEAVLVFKLWYGFMVAWMVWGVARGGAISPMFWQVVQLVVMGFCALAFLYSVRGAQDIRALAQIVIIAAIVKGLLVTWVYFVVTAPLGKRPFYATTHSDSVTFATAIVILATRVLEERTKQAIKKLLLITPLIIAFIVMNNRRLAFVCMGTALITAFLVMRPDKLKRKLTIGVVAMIPLFAVYVAVGANSDHPAFALARTVSTVSSSSDSSSLTREIENYNLIVTLKEALLMGTGFGHEYDEFIKADDISGGHPLYLYIPHNSVLWLVSVGGLIGFPLLWMYHPALAYFSARTYFGAQTPQVRAAALTTLGVTFILMVQAWGDMGLQSYTCAMLFSACYALSAKLCVSTDMARAEPAKPPTPHVPADRMLPAASAAQQPGPVPWGQRAPDNPRAPNS